MEKFNLKKALAGEEVVTRNGRKVTDIEVNKDAAYPVSARIEGEGKYKEVFTKTGRYHAHTSHIYDLFMK